MSIYLIIRKDVENKNQITDHVLMYMYAICIYDVLLIFLCMPAYCKKNFP